MTVNASNASLAVIDYEALANKDGREIQKLVQACESVGMFHLSIGNSRMKAIYDDIPSLLQAGGAFFDLPSDCEEKKQCIARDDFEQGKWALPATLKPHEERITCILQSLNRVVQTVITELCNAIQVDLAELSDDPTVPSDTALKLVYKPPVQEPGAVVQPWHTDFGLMTMMWYEEVSAQIPVYDADGKRTEDWQAVPVVDGALLVNIADELEAKCHGRLRSTVHRAVTPPGPKRVRRGLVYLLRPYKKGSDLE
ncbi:hypothetical protein V2A60_007182 [Cordyceps javanica]|uniref:Oxidoreductase, 2OG-Fe(II) oxygenase family n=1 Tax=Cordyceps javanica TaxID=43265 RepID=A0A545USS1_9HYPO|nr:oxidoreductase, 2OG-Fe(II) oxygenase family [Cordyceps javanica]TQW04264.1 oxidoreductase, 2OG-Fe(II) oxygenase family [Cordyceps javanica]